MLPEYAVTQMEEGHENGNLIIMLRALTVRVGLPQKVHTTKLFLSTVFTLSLSLVTKLNDILETKM